MAAPAVVNISKISASDIQFAEPRKNKQGGVSVAFQYRKQNVQFRFPQLGFPGGVLVKENEFKGGPATTSYTLSASFQGCDPYGRAVSEGTDDVSKSYNFLRDLQAAVLQGAVKNSLAWFGKTRGVESLTDSFKEFLSVSVDKTADGWAPNGKYPPSLRFKVPVYDGKVSMEVIGEDGTDIPVQPSNLPETFPKGCSAKIVAQGSIWVINGNFGVTWRPTYVQVSKRRRQTARDMFKEDVDDAEDVPAPVVGGAKAAFAEEDEEEEEQDQEEEDAPTPTVVVSAPAPAPVPAPAPAPAAASGRRKVAKA